MALSKIRNMTVILITLFLIAATQMFAAPMTVNGRYLYTGEGEQVILRGVNEMLIYSGDRTGSWVFDEIARTGANGVRVIAGNNEDVDLSADELATAIQNANNAGMILIAGVWMATCDWNYLQDCVDWWLRSDIIEAVQNNEDYFLLNIANEAGATVTNSQYLTGYTNAITELRNAGYQCPLVIDAASCGTAADQALSAYDSLLHCDPLSNIIVSWHTYNSGSTDDIKGMYDSYLTQAVAENICLILGEGPTAASGQCQASPYAYGIQKCQENEIGWLSWSWGLVPNGNCGNYFNWTEDGYYGNWEGNAGRVMGVTSDYSIANTSVRPPSLNYLTVSPGLLLFEPESNAQILYVASNGNWTINNDRDWINVSLENGSGKDTISITVQENPAIALRSGTITLTDGNIVKSVTIRQMPGGQGQVQTVPLSDFDSGSLDPFYSWGAPISIEANPDGTPGDSVALLDQTNNAWNGISSWWQEGDLFEDADSITVDVYANLAGVIKFHCDNSVSGGVDFDQLIEGVPAKTWTRYTLKVSDMPVSDYRQFAIQYDKTSLIYFDNFILYKTVETQDPYLIFDPATYPPDSLREGMEIVDIEGTKYLQVVVDNWNQTVTLLDSVMVPFGAEEINFEIKYATGPSTVGINNTWYKYLFLDGSGSALFDAEGDANTITSMKSLKSTCGNDVAHTNGSYINSFTIAGQNKSGWTALAGDTMWIGKTTFVNNTGVIDRGEQTPLSFKLEQNYPNPFNPATNITFTLSAPSRVRLSVFNTLGQKVATLVNERLNLGSYTYSFDGSNLPSGIYFYCLETDKVVSQKKMILIK